MALYPPSLTSSGRLTYGKLLKDYAVCWIHIIRVLRRLRLEKRTCCSTTTNSTICRLAGLCVMSLGIYRAASSRLDFARQYGYRPWRYICNCEMKSNAKRSIGHMGSPYTQPVQLHKARGRCTFFVFPSVNINSLVLCTPSKSDSHLGLAEGSFYPGMQYVMGSWYRRDELAKRSCIFHTSSGTPTMCSGYLMASVYNSSSRGGFAGWQWYAGTPSSVSMPYKVLPP